MKLVRCLLPTALLAAAVLPACADMNIGGQSRAAAMGGAGLASLTDLSSTSVINPAALGLMKKRIRLQLPNLNFRTDGASLSDIKGWSNDIWNLSGGDSIAMARALGRKTTTFDVDLSTGIGGAPVNLSAGGEARLRITPNAAFREFAETGSLPADPSQMAATVTAEVATIMPSFAAGFKVPGISGEKGDLWIGARLRMVKGKYISRTISWSGEVDPDNALETSDEPVQDASGLGGDFGVIYKRPGPANLTYGLSITNLLKPSLGNVKQESIWNLGVSAHPNKMMTVAADLVNLTRAYDERAALRVGMEIIPIKGIALRAGYSEAGFTSGFGLWGMDFAFANKTPLSIARTVRF